MHEKFICSNIFKSGGTPAAFVVQVITSNIIKPRKSSIFFSEQVFKFFLNVNW